MKKAKFTKVFMMVIILVASIILTTTALADTKPEYILEDPCEWFTALPGAQIYCGVHQGAGYQIEIPDNWNGDLLMWAHGYRFDPTYLWVEAPPFRSWLIENGYAWAASSYSGNYLDITVGMKDTKALVKFFQEEIAEPDHVYISGESMGGAVTVSSIEQWPNLYDGAMPTCGSVSQYEEYDYIWDYYVLASALTEHDATYPIPDDFVTSGQYAAVVNELAASPGMFPYLLNEQGEIFKNALEMRSGGERPLFDQAFNFWYGFMDLYWGVPVIQFAIDENPIGVKGIWFDNWNTVYQLDMDPALSPEEQALNDLVFRIQRDSQAVHPNGLKNIPVATGDIKVPVLSIHGIGDLLVPFSMEQIYAQRVSEHGASDLLVQRAIRDIVHCFFMEEEYTTAFSDLVTWVETGVKPAGDDFLDPAAVSDPYFGCQFTSEYRDYTDIPGLGFPA
ncbi:MAG: prolyl oligopeptidase family serine peptidase, partial [Anaerolineales bacterium]